MYVIDRGLRFARGFLLSYGPTPVKKVFWEQEFSSGKWNFIDNTADDCVYLHLNRFAENKTVLDLGCGPGNTANEMAPGYDRYVGVDISEEALAKGRRRSEANGRGVRNIFEQGDFINYVPSEKYDVILFRESMYHVPIGKIKPMLDRYSKYLNPEGVFIVRMYLQDPQNGKAKQRPVRMLEVIQEGFEVVEKGHYPAKSGSVVIVFRPK